MKTLIFGHRGAAGEAPENTLAGFRWSYETAGVRNFELDVHLTKDGKLAVIHDDTIDRTTDGQGRVGDYTLQELKKFNATAFFPEFGYAEIPSLGEVLDYLSAVASEFQLEIKTDLPSVLDTVCKDLLSHIRKYDIAGKVTVTSFDPYALRVMKDLAPDVKRGLISYSYSEQVLALAIDLGCKNACIPHKAGSKLLVRKAQIAGLEVTGWLGNRKEEADTLLDWGVDSITTNFPSFLIPYLKERDLLLETRTV